MLLNQFPDKKTFIQLATRCNVIPVGIEILADTETPVSLLKKLQQKQDPDSVFLFESVEGGERWGRYSFMGTSARSHVRIYSDQVMVKENGGEREIPHNGKPLNVLRDLMAGFRPADLPELPRFWGGLVGYLTYEMVSFIEKIPNRLPPDQPLAHFIITDELIIFDNIRNTLIAVAIVFLDDYSKNEEIGSIFENARKRLAAICEKMNDPLPKDDQNIKTDQFALTPLQDKSIYCSHVKKTKKYIKNGEIIQAVISQPFVCESAPDIWKLYRSQRYINPSPYLYYMHMGDIVLVGSSPETMVRLENGIATLRPIAGTRPRGQTEQEDRALADELLGDEKERAEHLMLVDLGRNDLGRVAETGTVQVTDLMFVERYSHVMHLVSNITCDLLPDTDAWDLLAATFPAGTLSGAPKVRAMEIIAELEETPRGPYGGSVGYVSFNGNMDMAITIRTAVIQNGQLTVRAGAGIVADSDPDREHQETVNKAMAIQRALELICGRQEEKI